MRKWFSNNLSFMLLYFFVVIKELSKNENTNTKYTEQAINMSTSFVFYKNGRRCPIFIKPSICNMKHQKIYLPLAVGHCQDYTAIQTFVCWSGQVCKEFQDILVVNALESLITAISLTDSSHFTVYVPTNQHHDW